MDILEFALEKERLSHEYYQQLADKTENIGLRNILKMLAEEELVHCSVIENMKSSIPIQLTETSVLDDAKDIFNDIKESFGKFNFTATEVELYRVARDNKRKSMEFYQQKALEVEDEIQKEIFEDLAADERKHYKVIDNICEFVEAPDCYLENAEFVHMAEDF